MTQANALAHQVGLMRRATRAQRFAAVRSLSGTVAALSWRALRRSMPEATENEISLAFVALHYGEDVAASLRRQLDAK